MTRKRVIKEEMEQCQKWALALIDKCVGFSSLTSFTIDKCGNSRRQARTVSRKPLKSGSTLLTIKISISVICSSSASDSWRVKRKSRATLHV